MKGKTVLITGGSSGIGHAAAALFLKQGAKVMIAGRKTDAGKKALLQLKEFSEEVDFMAGDISDSQSIRNLISGTVQRFGSLDIAFNNAGIEGQFRTVAESDEEELHAVIDTNLKGTWLCIKYELEQFKRQQSGGVIINTSSWLSKGALVNSSLYSASKAGVDAMIHAIALEAAPLGVRINNINPGYIVTPMFRRLMDPDSTEAEPLKSHAPIGRFAQPREVAELVLWLAGEKASFVTGQSFYVDGGLSITGPR